MLYNKCANLKERGADNAAGTNLHGRSICPKAGAVLCKEYETEKSELQNQRIWKHPRANAGGLGCSNRANRDWACETQIQTGWCYSNPVETHINNPIRESFPDGVYAMYL